MPTNESMPMTNWSNLGKFEAGKARRSARAVGARRERRARGATRPTFAAWKNLCAYVVVTCHNQSDNRRQTAAGRRRCRGACAAAAVLFFLLAGARADTLFLTGGEKLIGEVLAEDATKVVFESRTLGRVEVPRVNIEKIKRDEAPPAATPATMNPPPAAVTTSVSLTNEFQPWTSGPAAGDRFDWIQLKTGEWLAGRLKSLQDDKLEFDSEKLNLQSFEWKDVRTVRAPRLNNVRIENLSPMDGAVFVTTGAVKVVTSTTTNVYPRAALLAIAPTGDRERDKWTGSIALGFSLRSGSTSEQDFDAHLTLQRRTAESRLYLDYLGDYGTVNGVQTEENQRFAASYDYYLSRRLYVRAPDLEYYRDPLQNLNHRVTLGAGLGYDLIKTPRTDWNLTAGPAGQANWFSSVPTGESSTSQSFALVIATRFDIELTRRLDWIFEYRGQLTSREAGESSQHAASTLEFEIHKRLKLDLSVVWDRVASPQTESNGSSPKPDDLRFITSVGIDF